MTNFYHLHAHSKYSAKDALPSVDQMVARASTLGQEALALTDHGTVAGVHQLYRGCRKAGIKAMPGVEAYGTIDSTIKRPITWHLGIVSYTTEGYYNLINLVNKSNRDFKYKPLVSVQSLISLKQQGLLEGLAAFTGCYFGMTQTALRQGGYQGARSLTKMISELFDGNMYVEFQNHHIDDQDTDRYTSALQNLSYELSLPTAITTDSHYEKSTDQDTHDMLKRLSSWSEDPDSAIFPGDGYWLSDEDDMRTRFDPELFSNALLDMNELLDKYDLVLPELDTFSTFVPDLGHRNDDRPLWTRTLAELSARDLVKEPYISRLKEELTLISKLSFDDYLLLTAKVTDHMREEDVIFNARGSASGSIVCWLLGITEVDPIHYKLRFDRFLSGDRAKPPDIDLDIEHSKRKDVLAWIDTHYPTVKIGTWRELKLDKESSKGSLRVRYSQWKRKTGQDPDLISAKDLERLEILDHYGAYDGIGTHAAGVLVAPSAAHLARVPMTYIPSSKSMVTSLNKEDVEAAGYVKLDILGLRTLTAISETERICKVDHRSIKLSDSKVMRRISSGKTDGIFQLSGYTATNGVKRMKPRKFADIVDAMALFRPAAIQSGATDRYLSRRFGKPWIHNLHPMIVESIKDTNGELLYQEQLMGILRGLGLNNDDLNKTLKAIKSSNAATKAAAEHMASITSTIDELGAEQGFNKESQAWLRNAMKAYAEYGFNLAHAVAYARVAFITAWYATNEPLAYWTGILNNCHPDDESMLCQKATEDGIKIYPPDVNISSKGYTPNYDRNAIYKGLLSIHHVGAAAIKTISENAPYTDLDDFATRARARSVTGINKLSNGTKPPTCGGVVAALYHARALDSIS